MGVQGFVICAVFSGNIWEFKNDNTVFFLVCQNQNKNLEGRKEVKKGGREKKKKTSFCFFPALGWKISQYPPNIFRQNPDQNLEATAPLGTIIFPLKKKAIFLDFLPQSTHNCIVLVVRFTPIPLIPQSRTHSPVG